MASFFTAPRLNGDGSDNNSSDSNSNSTATSWTSKQGTTFSVSASALPGFSFLHARSARVPMSPGTATGPLKTGPLKVQQLSYEALVQSPASSSVLSGPAAPVQDTLKHPGAVLSSDTDILRIYLPFAKISFSWIDALFVHIHLSVPSVFRVELCIRSLLRPCLQDIFEGPKLTKDFFAMHQYTALQKGLEFFYLRPSTVDGVDRDCFDEYVDKDLLRAIEGLPEGDEMLSKILGEESVLFNQIAVCEHYPVNAGYGGTKLDDVML